MLSRQGGLATLGVLALAATPAQAQATEWDASARVLVLAGDAPPANDMPGAGVVVRRPWRDDWAIGFGLERYSFDFEEPYDVVGVGLDPDFGEEAIDAKVDSTVVSVWLERRYETAQPRGWSWFWTGGLGYAFLSADRITGPSATGGAFDIETQASDEVHVLASAGLRYSFASRWFVEAALHGQHHLADYDVTDRVSGATGEIDAQTVFGASGSFGLRF